MSDDRTTDWPARLRIHPTAFIAPGAVVVGEVTLGARSSVWFNTVVRGDTAAIEVGDDTNLQDNTVVHVDEAMPAVIGSRVTVGHRAIVHGCVVEDDVLVGMGAVILSGARVGAGSLIGAAALVRERQVIPPGSLAVGAPARVVGQVTDVHRAAIANGVHHYVSLARSYLARGFARSHAPARSDLGITARDHGPMTFLEWGRLIAALASGPDEVGALLESHGSDAFRRAPAPARWSALEVLGHLVDADRAVYLPRLERMLAADRIEEPDVDMRGWDTAHRYAAADPPAMLGAWRVQRAKLVSRLAPLGRADWARVALHSVRGWSPLGEMVRAWAEHDLEHRHQLARALEEVG
jgi:carbonic anhydrase/acetyltransferase-like protein (isoleucine patch superfamily)